MRLLIFGGFLALFSQFSKEFPGRCEVRAFFEENSGDSKTIWCPFGIRGQVLENRLPKRHGGSNPSSSATKRASTLLYLLFLLLQVKKGDSNENVKKICVAPHIFSD